MISRFGLAAGVAGVLVALATSALSGQSIGYTGSVGYATGSYDFTERTSSFSILNGLAVAGDRWRLSASIPVIIQNSGAVATVGGIRVPTGMSRGGMGPGSGMETPTSEYETVVGDPVIRGSVSVFQGLGAVRSVELRVMAKAPVADPTTGVGTGQWDAGGGLSMGFGAGRTYLFADASVWAPGDMPDLELTEYGTLSAGIGRPLGAGWSALASVSVSSPMVEGIDPPAALAGGLSYRIAEGRSLRAGASVGLTSSAPDVSVYMGWSAGP